MPIASPQGIQPHLNDRNANPPARSRYGRNIRDQSDLVSMSNLYFSCLDYIFKKVINLTTQLFIQYE